MQPAKRTGVRSSGKDVEVRRQAIMKAVQQAGNKSVDEIASMLGISKMTVHRDLDALSTKGLVRKERGRAVAGNSLLFESNFQFRLSQNVDIKAKIAKSAVDERDHQLGGAIGTGDAGKAAMPRFIEFFRRR